MWECGLKRTRVAGYREDALSLLMWECGLKPQLWRTSKSKSRSLLMWECGLKLCPMRIIRTQWLSHSLCGSVDWNFTQIRIVFVGRSHSLCGSVDWNRHLVYNLVWGISHSLCGSVDWNWKLETGQFVENVTPYVGVWIETETELAGFVQSESLLMWECGLKPRKRRWL